LPAKYRECELGKSRRIRRGDELTHRGEQPANMRTRRA
jgi:hypothetical protein